MRDFGSAGTCPTWRTCRTRRLAWAICLATSNTKAGASPNPGAYVSAKAAPGMLPYANYFWPAANGPELLDPSTNLPTGTAQSLGNPLRSVREDFGLVRFDSTISSKDSFSANFNGDDGRRGAPPAD